ncbi:hypothetical protein Hypma_012440 [Hypsizygus marmoreus]|uniref:Uncharacterized protein n=1 Tax=Hypsizygus marmoreus TaxID=39966 RepID=A0A369JL91_HYPMA|nr:hypothetical protein Hypma_012440 [Hypsizygus marmoreus]
MDVDLILPPFDAPSKRDWHWIAYIVNWIICRTQDECRELLQQTLPFLFELPTVTQQRNELTRRILRILADPSHSPSPQEQTGAYWLDILATDHRSRTARVEDEDALKALCDHLSGVTIQH